MNIALIMAGGTGTRMNHSTPKQYLLLNGAPIVLHTLRAFESCSAIDAICLACASSYLPLMQRMIQEHHLTKVRYFAEAGKDRRLTSKNAVEAVAPFCAPEDILLIHDAVRPFVTERIILENIRMAREYGAVYTVYPVQDTIVQSLNGKELSDIPDRSALYLGQTPQSFRCSLIQQAHQRYAAQTSPVPVTDDCSLVLQMGHPVYLVSGSKTNIKITTPEDMEIARFFAQKFSFAESNTADSGSIKHHDLSRGDASKCRRL